MSNRDVLEDQFIKETGQFAFLDPSKLNPKYVEWLENKLIQEQSLPINKVYPDNEDFYKLENKQIESIK